MDIAFISDRTEIHVGVGSTRFSVLDRLLEIGVRLPIEIEPKELFDLAVLLPGENHFLRPSVFVDHQLLVERSRLAEQELADDVERGGLDVGVAVGRGALAHHQVRRDRATPIDVRALRLGLLGLGRNLSGLVAGLPSSPVLLGELVRLSRVHVADQ